MLAESMSMALVDKYPWFFVLFSYDVGDSGIPQQPIDRKKKETSSCLSPKTPMTHRHLQEKKKHKSGKKQPSKATELLTPQSFHR